MCNFMRGTIGRNGVLLTPDKYKFVSRGFSAGAIIDALAATLSTHTHIF